MKINLNIDGNYLLNKDVFILHQMKSLFLDLEKLLERDIERMLKMYPFDNIYFFSDSRMRWRSDFFPGYKKNRKPDSKIDWDYVYEEYDKLKEKLSLNPRVKFYEVDRAEGDDLIAHTITESNKKGYSNLLIASDGDLKQLLNFDLGLEYINVMHNYKFSDMRTYWPENYNVFLHEVGKSNGFTSFEALFDMDEDSDLITFFSELSEKTKSEEVNSESCLFCKIVSGDRKDNVPSSYIKLTKTGKEMGIGDAGSKTIYTKYKEVYPEPIDYDNDTFIERLTDVISEAKNVTSDIIKEDIKNNIIRNRRLLRLDGKYLPSEIYEKFKNTIVI